MLTPYCFRKEVIGTPEAAAVSSRMRIRTPGIFRQYSVEGSEVGLRFDDLPPGYIGHWRRARKVLRPTPESFEKQLEVDAGEGFVPYCVISMERVTARAPN